MVFFITVVLVVPLGLVGLLIVGEAQTLVESVRAWVMGEKGDLAGSLGDLPFFGDELRRGLLNLREDPQRLQEILNANRNTLIGLATRAMGDLVENGFKILVCIFSAYFLFRHGELLVQQARAAVRGFGGPRIESLLIQIKETVRAVVFGLVMTALAQAGLAALGFYVAGVAFPLLLALLTFVFSFIPFGPPIIWVPASISVMIEGRMLAGILLFIWGAGAISSIDNVLRPIFIGQATRMPVLMVFIAVLGGVMSFGMVGLFVGPVIMAIALALWREWVARQEEARGATPVRPVPVAATGASEEL
jgi:predicted PurR-regulated permease PerM